MARHPDQTRGAGRTVVVRDGREVFLRPIRPEDKELLKGHMERMSPESRYLRFLGFHERLSESELSYLTEVDHHDHEAIIALEPGSGEAIGVARFVRLDEDPVRAEAAVAVVDDWHGRGLGRALLERLSERAREEGVTRFMALVQAGNQRAVAALSALGPTRREMQSGVVELDIELAPEGLGVPLASALRAAAGQLVGTAPLARRIRIKAREAWLGRSDPLPLRPPLHAPVLVGVDGSDAARRALECAVELAAGLGATLHLATAFRAGAREGEAEELLRAELARLPERDRPAVLHARRGDPADVLVELAGEVGAGLLVVGQSGSGLVSRLVLGSVASRVLHRAPCHVLVERGAER